MRKILLLLFLVVNTQQIIAQCNLKIVTTIPTLCEGQNIPMTATGVPTNTTLQWKKNGTDIDGAVTATYQSNSAGIYEAKSVRSNEPWSKLNFKFADFLNKIFFVDTKVGWLIQDYDTIKKTTDGGITWVVQYVEKTNSLWNIYFLDAKNGFVSGSNTTLLRTTDGGITWTPATVKGNTQFRFYHLVHMSFINQNIGWIISSQGESIKTTDGGKTWIPEESSISNLNIQTGGFLEENVRILVSTDGLVYKTIDDGKNWKSKYRIPKDINIRSFFFQNNKVGWLIGDIGYVLNTIDGGETWTEKKGIDFSKSSFLREILFTDAKIGFLFDEKGGYHKTIDGGNTWIKQTIGRRISLRSVTFTDSNNGWVGGYKGTMVKTTDGGITWKTLINGNTEMYKSNHFVDNLTGYAVGDEGYIGKTVNGGITWDNQNSNEINTISKVQFFDQNIGWALIPNSSVILRTIDGGNNWTKKQLALKSPQSMYFTNAKNGFVVGAKNIIYQTTDGGSTWSLTKHTWDTTNNSSSLNVVHFSDSKNGWAAGNRILLNTTDGGISWSQNYNISRDFGASKVFNDVFFIDNLHGVALYSPFVDYTSDGGKTWILGKRRYQDYGYEDGTFYKTSIRFVNTKIGFITREDGLIFTSPDGGMNWYEQSKLTSESLNNLYALDEKNVWAVGSNGTVMKYTSPILCTSNTITINPKPAVPTLAWSNSDGKLTATTTTTSSQLTWLKGVDELKNITTTTYQPTSSGSYSVRVTDGNGCSEISKAVEITILASENPLNDSGVSVYPNPSSNGIFKVAYTRFSNEMEATMQVIGLDGLPLNSQKMVRQNNTFEGEINASNLATGIYLLQIISGEQKAVVKISIAK